MRLYALSGKLFVNVDQLVSAHEEKGGDEWRLRFTDDKEFVVTKHQWGEIKLLDGAAPVPGPITLPPTYRLYLEGTAAPA